MRQCKLHVRPGLSIEYERGEKSCTKNKTNKQKNLVHCFADTNKHGYKSTFCNTKAYVDRRHVYSILK